MTNTHAFVAAAIEYRRAADWAAVTRGQAARLTTALETALAASAEATAALARAVDQLNARFAALGPHDPITPAEMAAALTRLNHQPEPMRPHP